MIFKEINTKLRAMLGEVMIALRQETMAERVNQLTQININTRLWKGDHNSIPQFDNGMLRFVPFYETPAGAAHNSRESLVRQNYFAGDGSKLVGALSIAPNMRIELHDKDDHTLMVRQRVANNILTRLYTQWRLEFLMPTLVEALWTRGNIFLHTPYITNPARYGYHQQPVMGTKQIQVEPAHFLCPNCGRKSMQQELTMTSGMCPDCRMGPLDSANFKPAQYMDVVAQTGTQQLPAGSVDLNVYDSRTTFTSFQLNKWSDCKWLCHDEEHYKGSIISAFPWMAEDEEVIRMFSGRGHDDMPDTHSLAINEISRNYSGTRQTKSPKNWWRYTQWWFTPEMFYNIDTKEIRDALLQSFPYGAKFTVVNGLIAEIKEAQLHREWVGCNPFVGAGFYNKPLGEEHSKSAYLINEMAGIMLSNAEKGAPLTFYDSELFELDHLRNSQVRPLEMIKVIAGNGKSMRDMFFQTQPAQMNPAVPEVYQNFVSASRENGNIMPNMYGAGPPEQTLGATSLKRDQAMQPHNVTYGNIRAALGVAMDNGIYQLAINAQPDGTVYFSPKFGEVTSYKHQEIHTLPAGGFYTWVNDRIPMNWGQIEAKTWQLLELPPDISGPLLGLHNPENIETVQAAIGFVDLKATNLEAYRKVMRNIRILSAGQPIVAPDPMTGAPSEQPSIPVDEFEDDHQFVVAVIKEWTQTEKADELKQANPMGYRNVIAWAKAHLTIINMMMMAQQGQVPPGGAGSMQPSGGPSGPGPQPNQPEGAGSTTAPQAGPPIGTPAPGAGAPPVQSQTPPPEAR